MFYRKLPEKTKMLKQVEELRWLRGANRYYRAWDIFTKFDMKFGSRRHLNKTKKLTSSETKGAEWKTYLRESAHVSVALDPWSPTPDPWPTTHNESLAFPLTPLTRVSLLVNLHRKSVKCFLECSFVSTVVVVCCVTLVDDVDISSNVWKLCSHFVVVFSPLSRRNGSTCRNCLIWETFWNNQSVWVLRFCEAFNCAINSVFIIVGFLYFRHVQVLLLVRWKLFAFVSCFFSYEFTMFWESETMLSSPACSGRR